MPLTKKIRIVFSVINCISYDQRILKMAEALAELNCDITIIGRREDRQCNNIVLPFRIKRFRMIFHRGFLFYMSYNIRLFFFLLFNRFDLLVADDLDTLLPNYLVSRIKRLPLVYDSHEYFTGVPELQDRRFVKWVWTTVEKHIFPHLQYILTVSDSVAAKYHEIYGILPLVIRNFPRSASDIIPFSRSELGIPETHLIIILQGGGLNIDRGGEELVDAVAGMDEVVLFIVGSGDVLNALEEKVKLLQIGAKVRFIPKLPWAGMMRYTKSADAGLTLDKNTNLNYRFSLPNKLFDYISAGIAVIASDLPEVSGILAKYHCGIIIPEVNAENINKAVIKLRDDRALLNKLKENALYASEYINWAEEKKKVTEFYSGILEKMVLKAD